MTAHSKKISQIFQEHKVDPQTGLDEREVQKRQQEFGLNALPKGKKLASLALFLRQFKNPLVAILIFAAFITLILQEYIDTTVIFIVVSFETILGFAQEHKAQESILALQKISIPRAKVLRAGQEQDIDAEQVTVGDILIFSEGDQIVADARLIDVHELLLDESILTGESTRVRKQVDPVSPKAITGDQKSMVFAGTLVVGGHGRAVVVKIGPQTEIGEIAKVVVLSEGMQTPLQRDLSRFSIVLTAGILILASLVFVIGISAGHPATLMFLFAVALAVSAIPEDLVIQVTIALAIAVNSMAKRGALARTLPAVEGLGAVTVIAADKTGTLTQNKLKVIKVFLDGESYEEDHVFETPTFLELIQVAVLCNNATLTTGDPLERALLEFAQFKNFKPYELRGRYPREMEIPFSSFTRVMATFNLGFGSKKRLLVKGAPKEVIKVCEFELMAGKMIKLGSNVKNQILHQARQMADQGLKPIVLARKEVGKEAQADITGLTFVGLVGMADSLRPEAVESIQKIQSAGIRVLMLTGDHRLTAANIARSAGIKDPDQVVKGADLEKLPKGQLKKLLRQTNVFARVTPQHKLKLIELLQEEGEVVAMTGDGVNDAPALTKADIGVAMGQGGTDVARSASDLVLEDNNFATIVAAIEEGRAIFDNLKKVILYLFSTNLGEILVVLGSFLLRLPLPLYPTQILWLNLVTDGLPDNALIFEPKEKNVLMRSPRKPHSFIFNQKDWIRILLFGVIMAGGSLWLFVMFLPQGIEKARTVALTAMAVFQLLNAFNMQSNKESLFTTGITRNWYLFFAVFLSFFFQFLVVKVEFLMDLFRTVPLSLNEWLLILLIASSVVLVEEARKLLNR